jgi:hypothetical protein
VTRTLDADQLGLHRDRRADAIKLGVMSIESDSDAHGPAVAVGATVYAHQQAEVISLRCDDSDAQLQF